MIKEIYSHPVPKFDARGEEILLSIHKFATILGDHVANTDIHVQSLITDDEIDELVTSNATDTEDPNSALEGYYTKGEIDAMGFLTSIPNDYITEEELKLYISGIEGDITEELKEYINTTADLDNYYDKSYIDSLINDYATQEWVLSKGYITDSDLAAKNYATIAYVDSKISSGISTTDSYLYGGTLNTDNVLVLNVKNQSDVKINLSSLASNSGSGSSSSTSTKQYSYTNVLVYKATSSTTDLHNDSSKPSNDYIFNYTTNEWTKLPSGWYRTPEEADNAYSATENDYIVWVSYNNLCSNGTSTGWTVPVLYLDIKQIIDDAKDAAAEEYEKELNDASSELNQTILDANDKLAIAQSLIDQFEAGDISGFGVKLAELEASIKAYGWNITENADGTKTVDYADAILTPDRIIQEVSKITPSAESAGSVGAAIQEMIYNCIKLKVYDYDKYHLDESYLTLTPTQLVLSCITGNENTNGTIDASTIRGSIIKLAQDNIRLSITNNSNGTKGCSFEMSLTDNGTSKTVLDTDEFIITGTEIADAIEAGEMSINGGKTRLESDGSAWFGSDSTYFDADGSGHTANGNISWESDGALTVNASGTFNGAIYASSGSFTGDVNAKTFCVLDSDNTPALFTSTYGELKSSGASFTSDAKFLALNLDESTPMFVYRLNNTWYYLPFTQIGNKGEATGSVTKYTTNNTYLILNGKISTIYPALTDLWNGYQPENGDINEHIGDYRTLTSYVQYCTLDYCTSTDSNTNGITYIGGTDDPYAGYVISSNHDKYHYEFVKDTNGANSAGTHYYGYHITQYASGKVVNEFNMWVCNFHVDSNNNVDKASWS